MWYRTFSPDAAEVPPAAILAHVLEAGFAVEAHFRGDDLGWTGCEMKVGAGSPLYLERFLSSEDDIRDQLNSWAAWLETADYAPRRFELMERVIQTQQLVTLRKPVDCPDEAAIDRLCLLLCRLLAVNGMYQIDGEGFFAADGELLLKEY